MLFDGPKSLGFRKNFLTKFTSRLVSVTIFSVLANLMFFVPIQISVSTDAEAAANNKRIICHRTKATKNPYRKITVSVNSLTRNNGHKDHGSENDVWTSSDVNGGDWGDIIPPDDRGRDAKNWTTAGEAIFKGQTFVPSTGRPACRGMTLKDYVDALSLAGVSDADIAADLNLTDADEDKAILAKTGQSGFTASNLATLADASVAISATTKAPSDISTSGATLNGTFKTDSTVTFWRFEYNLGDPTFKEEPLRTTCNPLSATNGTFDRNTTISSLSVNQKYFYRALITDNCSTPTILLYGEVNSFTTASTTYRVTYDANTGTGEVPLDANAYILNETAFVFGNSGGLVKSGARFKYWSTSSTATLRAGPISESSPPLLRSSPDFKALKVNGSNWNFLKAKSVPSYDFALGSGSQITVDRNITLYAIYEPAFSVTYFGNTSNSGTVPVDSTAYAANSTVTVLGNSGTLAKTGYSFGGWCTAQVSPGSTCASGPGTSYAASATFSITTNVSLYAVWTANSYSITYNANGGSGTISATTFTFGNSATISNNSFTRSGYTFQNWYTNSNGSGGTSYAGGDQYSSAANLPLFAIWSGNRYVYNGNTSDSGTAPADQIYAGTTLTARTNTFGKTNFSFYGWCLTAPSAGTNCPGTKYNPGTNLPIPDTSTVNLYAVWSNATLYTITYDTQGGSAVGPSTYASGDSVSLPSAPIRNGYTFNGWFLQDTGGSALGSSITPSPATSFTVYAQWIPIPYQISYNGNGSTSGTVPNSATRNYSETYTVLSPGLLAKTGHTFAYWHTASDGTSQTSYLVGETFTVLGAVTLYAIWVADTYQISYSGNSNDGGSVPANQSKVHDVNLTLASNSGSLTRSGFTFNGWNTAANGSGTAYAVGATYSLNVAAILYAQWTPVSQGGGTPAPAAPPPPPVITSISASLLCATTNDVLISGSAFEGARVTFDGTAVVIKQATSSSLLVTLPAAALGIKALVVTTPNGTATTSVNYLSSAKPKFQPIRIPYLSQGVAINLDLLANDTLRFKLSGRLPSGVTFNETTGLISGTPTENGVYVLNIVAVGVCGEDNSTLELDVDAVTPNAMSHRINFLPGTCELTDSAKASFEQFIEKIKGLSPRNIIPDIYISGGSKNSDPNSPIATCRQESICDLLLIEDLTGDILTDVFSGAENRIEIIVYWPRPNDDL